MDAGTGFDTHPHRDMEIVTWVLEGALAHEDSAGSSDVVEPGEIGLGRLELGLVLGQRPVVALRQPLGATRPLVLA